MRFRLSMVAGALLLLSPASLLASLPCARFDSLPLGLRAFSGLIILPSSGSEWRGEARLRFRLTGTVDTRVLYSIDAAKVADRELDPVREFSTIELNRDGEGIRLLTSASRRMSFVPMGRRRYQSMLNEHDAISLTMDPESRSSGTASEALPAIIYLGFKAELLFHNTHLQVRIPSFALIAIYPYEREGRALTLFSAGSHVESTTAACSLVE